MPSTWIAAGSSQWSVRDLAAKAYLSAYGLAATKPADLQLRYQRI